MEINFSIDLVNGRINFFDEPFTSNRNRTNVSACTPIAQSFNAAQWEEQMEISSGAKAFVRISCDY